VLLDIGAGILLAIWVSWFWQINLSLGLVLAGIVFALLPDADFFVELAKRGRVGGKIIGAHRELTHFPITYVPIVAIIYVLFGEQTATLFSLAVVFHLLHDGIGIGWGIKYLWPFSKKTYKFFSEKDGKISSRLVVSWEDEELKKTVARYGDPNWIKNIYLRPSFVSIIELLGFIASLAVLYFYLTRARDIW